MFIISLAAALFLLLTYFSRAAGFPSSLLVLIAGLWTLIASRRRALNIQDIASGVALGLSLFLYLETFKNRGPSFTDAVFIFSMMPFFVSLFRRGSFEQHLFALGAVLIAWAYVSGWEFPSTFSPFVLYGGVELLQLPFLLVLSYMIARKSTPGTGRAVGTILAGAGLLVFEAGGMNPAAFSFGYTAAALLAGLFLVVLWRWSPGVDVRTLAVSVSSVPLLFLVISLTQHVFPGFLPLPFDARVVAAATVLFVFYVWLAGVQIVLKPSSLVLAAVIAGFLSMFPYEINRLYHIGSYYEVVSHGYEFLGTYLVAWLIVMLASADNLPVWQRIASSVAGLYAGWKLFYARLFHHFSEVPYSFFKDLGTPDASWVRIPAFPYLAETVCTTAFIILVVYFVSGRRAGSAHVGEA